MTRIDDPEFILSEPEFDPWLDPEGEPILEIDPEDAAEIVMGSGLNRNVAISFRLFDDAARSFWYIGRLTARLEGKNAWAQWTKYFGDSWRKYSSASVRGR